MKSISIIGSGIIGICSALKLQQRGYRVTLMDKNTPASGCSKGNAGHFAIEQVQPLANWNTIKSIPSILFDPNGPLKVHPMYLPKAIPWLIKFIWASRPQQFNRGTQALTELNKHAMSAYKPLVKEANAAHLVKNTGYLLIFEGKNAIKLMNDASKNYHNTAHKKLSVIDVATLEPHLKNYKSALYFPNTYHTIDPEKFSLQLFKSFIGNGGIFEKKEIREIKLRNKSICLKTDNKDIKTEKLLIAAGIHSKHLVKNTHIKVPLDTERGYHLMLKQKKLISRPVAFAQRHFIMTPMMGGTRLAGTVEFAGTQIKPDWTRAESLLTQAHLMVRNINHSEKTTHWMGFRPSLPDSLPVIDYHPDNRNVLFAFGHQHLGLTQAAITADLVTSLADQQQPTIDISAFSIKRF